MLFIFTHVTWYGRNNSDIVGQNSGLHLLKAKIIQKK